MFRAAMGPSSGDTTVFMRHLVLVILCGWLSGMQEHMLLHTGQSSTQNNKYQVWHKHSCISWWWTHSSPKHVEIDKYKYTKKKVCTKLVYLQDNTEIHRSTKHKKVECFIYLCFKGKIMAMDFSLHIKNVHLYVCSFNFYFTPFYGLRDHTFSLQSLA